MKALKIHGANDMTTEDVDRFDPACRAWVDRAVAAVEADAHRSAGQRKGDREHP